MPPPLLPVLQLVIVPRAARACRKIDVGDRRDGARGFGPARRISRHRNPRVRGIGRLGRGLSSSVQRIAGMERIDDRRLRRGSRVVGVVGPGDRLIDQFQNGGFSCISRCSYRAPILRLA